jgi:hypothetical protein
MRAFTALMRAPSVGAFTQLTRSRTSTSVRGLLIGPSTEAFVAPPWSCTYNSGTGEAELAPRAHTENVDGAGMIEAGSA